MFAYGEGQSKKTLAGIVFGVGMAIGAVKFAATGMSEGLVRISVGIEDWRDLLADFEQALERC